MGGLQGPDGMRMEGTGYLFDFEGWGITSGEEGLSEVGGVGVEIIRIAAHMPTLDGQKKGMECLVDEA